MLTCVPLGRYVASSLMVLLVTKPLGGALTASVDSCAELKIECPFSGVTSSGRVWRKMPESDARRKAAMLGVWGPTTGSRL